MNLILIFGSNLFQNTYPMKVSELRQKPLQSFFFFIFIFHFLIHIKKTENKKRC